MKKIYLLPAIIFCSIAACHQLADQIKNEPAQLKDSGQVSIIWFEGDLSKVIDTNAKATIIGTGYSWSEGPVWLAKEQKLIFSDVPQNKIFQWKQGDSTSVYLEKSGYTDTLPRKGETGSNGLTLDKNGNLLLCQSGNRQVVRMNGSVDSPKASYTVLAKDYKGKRFNSPNDLIMDSKNNIYFTDPIYGLPEGEHDPERALTFVGVYKIHSDGKLQLLIDSIPRPNGIALSADEKTLYIASSDENKAAWYAYQLDENGNIQKGGILLNAMPLRRQATVNQGPDGFKLDKAGNIFSAGPDGINIISPQGKRIGLIKIAGRSSSNCVFNDTKDVLFVTADDVVLRIPMHSSKP
jgi:gluconolactonase